MTRASRSCRKVPVLSCHAVRQRSGTASVSLNTSVLYVGQSVGSAAGGMLYARDLLRATGYVSIAFVALALITLIGTRRMSPAS
jgi:predicted MFS family arabinose efflux permease